MAAHRISGRADRKGGRVHRTTGRIRRTGGARIAKYSLYNIGLVYALHK
jgi:hypothetical protein